ncbi:TPA: DUF551 domain-containing protein [Escherichia coli]|nr:DUF551 domain-containing protein [Escherichia coli]HCN6293773.1 DUF551 domain-containing protein [Escherichia coli]HCN9874457.1 DUF551 domain-containing protein [Escherichia coli]HCN9919264.1 DUF551 domain-containing protein [Escherichia coli]
MTTLTDKELIKEIKERIGSLDVRDNIERRAYEIALASLEAEAVMFCISGQNVDSEEHVSTSKAVVDAWVEEWNQVDGSHGEPLYKTMPLYYHAALPAPVVPEEATPENVEMLSGYVSTYKLTDSERDIAAEIWNACRAAMLHGAEPASNHEELPLDYLQGQKDGLEWAAQLAEANHPQTGDWLYDDPLELAKAIRKGPDMPEFDGPTPVTLDGWISCSERMPEDTKMLLAFSQGEIVAAYWNWVVNPIDYKKYRAFTYLSGNILDDVTHWMPLPEPPQEVNRD